MVVYFCHLVDHCRLRAPKGRRPFESSPQASSYLARDLAWDGSSCLLLNDDRSGPDVRSGDHIANPDLDEVTAAKPAVDRKIDQGSVPYAYLEIKEEAIA